MRIDVKTAGLGKPERFGIEFRRLFHIANHNAYVDSRSGKAGFPSRGAAAPAASKPATMQTTTKAIKLRFLIMVLLEY